MATGVEVEVEVEVKGEGEGKSGATPPKPPAPAKAKYLDFVYLLPAEHDKLIAKYGHEGAAGWIERVNRYAHKIGEKKFKKKYSSHYHVILEWDEKDGGNGNANAGLQTSGSGRPGRNFAAEREAERKSRLARVCGTGDRTPRGIHREAVRGNVNEPLEGQAVEIPEVEVERPY